MLQKSNCFCKKIVIFPYFYKNQKEENKNGTLNVNVRKMNRKIKNKGQKKWII